MKKSYSPHDWYILEGEIFRRADTWKEVEDFSADFESRRIAIDYIVPTTHFVSTVFLIFDHAYGHGSPILFETMIFSDCSLDQTQVRYHTYEAAITGHRKLLEQLTRQTLHHNPIKKYKEIHP